MIPGRMQKAFLNTEKELNKAGVYGVTLYPLGVPHTVVVDDSVPQITELDDNGNKMNGMAAPGVDKSFWGPMLEKAFAKMYGNF